MLIDLTIIQHVHSLVPRVSDPHALRPNATHSGDSAQHAFRVWSECVRKDYEIWPIRFSGTFKVNSLFCAGQGTRAVNPGFPGRSGTVGRYEIDRLRVTCCFAFPMEFTSSTTDMSDSVS